MSTIYIILFCSNFIKLKNNIGEKRDFISLLFLLACFIVILQFDFCITKFSELGLSPPVYFQNTLHKEMSVWLRLAML